MAHDSLGLDRVGANERKPAANMHRDTELRIKKASVENEDANKDLQISELGSDNVELGHSGGLQGWW